MYDLREAVAAAAASDVKCPSLLDAAELDLCARLAAVLTPFEHLTTALSAQANPTLSLVLPGIQSLRRRMSTPADGEPEAISRVREAAVRALSTRFFENAALMRLLFECSTVDPRFKKSPVDEGVDVLSVLKSLCASCPHPPAAVAEPREAGPSAPPDGGLAGLLSWVPAAVENTEDELRRYFIEAPTHPDSDPLDWWRHNGHRFPSVARVAERYLAIPSTGAPVERMFSLAGSTADQHRWRMAPATAEMLVFLHQFSSST
jgi:hypothetical protein